MDHTAIYASIHEWNEPYLPLSFQMKLVLSYRRDGRLSWRGFTTVSKQSVQGRYVTDVEKIPPTLQSTGNE